MSARVELTKKYATAYANAGKKDKGRILDQVVEVTGWNRDHARQQLRGRLRQPLGRAQATIAVIDGRRSKPRKYSCDALRVLQRVWSTSGGLCGKYLAASMPPGRPLAASRSVEAGSSFRPESGGGRRPFGLRTWKWDPAATLDCSTRVPAAATRSGPGRTAAVGGPPARWPPSIRCWVPERPASPTSTIRARTRPPPVPAATMRWSPNGMVYSLQPIATSIQYIVS